MYKSSFEDEIYYKLFIRGGCWLATRHVSEDSSDDCADFCIYQMYEYTSGDGSISTPVLYNSNNNAYYTEWNHTVRPIVTLGSDVQIDTSDSTKDGSSAINAWPLK